MHTQEARRGAFCISRVVPQSGQQAALAVAAAAAAAATQCRLTRSLLFSLSFLVSDLNQFRKNHLLRSYGLG